jgi:hypothetical protein
LLLLFPERLSSCRFVESILGFAQQRLSSTTTETSFETVRPTSQARASGLEKNHAFPPQMTPESFSMSELPAKPK